MLLLHDRRSHCRNSWPLKRRKVGYFSSQTKVSNGISNIGDTQGFNLSYPSICQVACGPGEMYDRRCSFLAPSKDESIWVQLS